MTLAPLRQYVAVRYPPSEDDVQRIEAMRNPNRSQARVHPVTNILRLPPKPPRCIGREHEVETLVGALLAGEPTPVLGPAGIGKSTVCLQALHDRRIGERFDGRRYFVRLDGASTAKDMLAGVAKVLGIPADQASIANVAGISPESRPPWRSTIWRRRGTRRLSRPKRCFPSLPPCSDCRLR